MKNISEMSRDERITAKQMIDIRTHAVLDAYHNSNTPAEAVADLANDYGYAEAVEMVATVVNRVSPWDGRIFDSVREWAKATNAPSNEECEALGRYGVDSYIHSVHVNQLGQAMKDYKPTDEEPDDPTFTEEASDLMNASPTFPTITEDAQQAFEAQAETDETPTICGSFGRGCRCMNARANHAPCLRCPLAKFANTYTGEPDIFEEAKKSITENKSANRSAWGRGVTAYALELLEELAEAVRGGWVTLEELGASAGARKSAMLNGARDWSDYSWGGCSLIYNGDIAERLCTPSELKRTRGGEWRPNASEEWLDTQARALFQASNRASRALAEALKSRA